MPIKSTDPTERDGLMRMREELQTYACLQAGIISADLGGQAGTDQIGEQIISALD